MNKVKVICKTTSTGEQVELETLEKETKNSTTFKSIKTEITGTDGKLKYVPLGSGKIQISKYIGSETNVVIPAEYDGYKVYCVGNKDAKDTSSKRYNIFGETNSTSNTTIKSITLTTITIPASVTEIDSATLVDMKALGKNKVKFAEGSIFEFKSNGSVGKK